VAEQKDLYCLAINEKVRCWLARRREAVLAGHEGEGPCWLARKKRCCTGRPERKGAVLAGQNEKVLYWPARKKRCCTGRPERKGAVLASQEEVRYRPTRWRDALPPEEEFPE
jgi:hypothetical protein